MDKGLGLTEVGVWLIGVGSVVLLVGVIVGAPRAVVGGLSFGGPLASAKGRLAFALEVAGAVHAAVGSVFIAVGELDMWWLGLCVLATAAILVYGLNVWKQHEYRVDLQRQGTKTPEDAPEGQWRRRCLSRCSTWRWSIRHAFEDETWPRDCFRLAGAPPRAE